MAKVVEAVTWEPNLVIVGPKQIVMSFTELRADVPESLIPASASVIGGEMLLSRARRLTLSFGPTSSVSF